MGVKRTLIATAQIVICLKRFKEVEELLSKKNVIEFVQLQEKLSTF